jgi:hypothetical protein
MVGESMGSTPHETWMWFITLQSHTHSRVTS